MYRHTPYISDLIKLAAKKKLTDDPNKIIVNDKRSRWTRPVSGTIGRVPGMFTGIMSADPAYFKKGATKADMEKSLKNYRKGGIPSSKKKGAIPLEIHSGHGRPVRDLKRVWARKDHGPISKLVGSGITLARAPFAAAMRADHYNEGAHSITSYHNSEAVKARELGEAENFSRIHPKAQQVYALGKMLPRVKVEDLL